MSLKVPLMSESFKDVFVPPWSADDRNVKPVLGTFRLFGLLFLATTGGAYAIEGCVGAAGLVVTLIFVCVLPITWGLPTAIAVSELSVAIPSNAGVLMWTNVTQPTFITFMCAQWTIFLNFLDNSLYPTIFVDYLARLVPIPHYATYLVKIAMIASCALLNIFGVDIVGKLSIVFCFIVVVPFILLFGQGMASIGPCAVANIHAVPAGGIHWAAFIPLITWNISGFDSAGHLAEEIRAPGKVVLRAMGMLLVSIVFTYAMPLMAAVVSTCDTVTRTMTPYNYTESFSTLTPNGSLACPCLLFDEWEDGHFVSIASHVGGHWLSVVMVTGAMMSMFGFMLTLLCTTSRALAGIADLGALPKVIGVPLSTYHPVLRTPVLAIILNSICSGALALALDFSTLIDATSSVYCMRLVVVFAAAIIVKFKHPTLPRVVNMNKWVALVVFGFQILYGLGVVILGFAHSWLSIVISGSIIVWSFVFGVFFARYGKPEGLGGKIERVPVEPSSPAATTYDGLVVDVVFDSDSSPTQPKALAKKSGWLSRLPFLSPLGRSDYYAAVEEPTSQTGAPSPIPSSPQSATTVTPVDSPRRDWDSNSPVPSPPYVE